ncbi:hypothetical protein BTO18_07240 [Polaribacter porphyrae]|uniref:Uncharacterized protein n=1 Tax=Polaribacter porphyrae TaxID=1137780 RepID=A0A2S7WN18_9FLAO|nr:hypothetical protein BTO18_07240 [Polaribacter porphyrae]
MFKFWVFYGSRYTLCKLRVIELTWFFLFFYVHFVLKQNEPKVQALHLQRSITFSMAKRKELHFLLVSVRQLSFLHHLQTIDSRLPDAMAFRL